MDAVTDKARSRRQDRAEVILDAAETLLRRSGTRTLTIDAVAVEAGLSKGGVLHHYASKDALVTALAVRKVGRIRAGIAACLAAAPDGPAAQPLALVAHARKIYAEECGFPDSLLIASADNAGAAAAFSQFLGEQLAAMGAIEARSGEGAALSFAVLGLMLSRSLDFHRIDGDALDRLFDALEAQARALPEDAPPADQ